MVSEQLEVRPRVDRPLANGSLYGAFFITPYLFTGVTCRTKRNATKTELHSRFAGHSSNKNPALLMIAQRMVEGMPISTGLVSDGLQFLKWLDAGGCRTGSGRAVFSARAAPAWPAVKLIRRKSALRHMP